MNGLFFIVVFVILLGALNGYRLGLLRVIYSLFSWILVFAFVTWATPYIATYLEEHTSIEKTIEEKCLSYIEESSQQRIEEETGGDASEQQEQLQDLGGLGIRLPESVISSLTESAAGTADEILENSGVYDRIAEGIAHFIVEGIAFFLALIIVSIISRYILGALNLVSHLPIIHGINKTLGIFAGVLKGLLIVWIAFYIIAICCTSELGARLVAYIRENAFLTYLYENNAVLDIIMAFL